jgi:virginiamycin B lyase
MSRNLPGSIAFACGLLIASAPPAAAGDLDAHGQPDPSVPLLTQTEFTIRANPAGLTSGPNGDLWYTANGLQESGHVTFVGWIGRLNPVTGETVETFLPGDVRLWGIASATGRIWFGEADGTGNFLPQSGYLGSFVASDGPVSAGRVTLGQSAPLDLTPGPNGNLWFTTYGLADPQTHLRGPAGVDRDFADGSVSTVASRPAGHLTTGPDGYLWFTMPTLGRIGRLKTTGEIEEFGLSDPSASPDAITAVQDGALWFTESGASRIGRISTSGEITEYEIPSGGNGKAIVEGPDGAVWFRKSDSLVRVLPPTSIGSTPTFQEFPAATRGGGETLLVGPEGNLWYGAGTTTIMFELRLGVLIRVETQNCPGGDLCLAGRFRVRLDWRAPNGVTSGAGIPVSQSAGFGYFWFFSPNNVEVAVKIVDGRQVDGHFWVFGASLTDVEFTLTVTDAAAGSTRTYKNPAGKLASFADTNSF